MHTILDLYAKAKELFSCGNYRGKVKSRDLDETMIFTLKRRRLAEPKISLLKNGSNLSNLNHFGNFLSKSQFLNTTPNLNYYYFNDKRSQKSKQTELIKHSLNFDSDISSRMEIIRSIWKKKKSKCGSRGKTSNLSRGSSDLESRMDFEMDSINKIDKINNIQDEYEDLVHFAEMKQDQENYPLFDYQTYRNLLISINQNSNTSLTSLLPNNALDEEVK